MASFDVPEALKQRLALYEPDGTLSKQLVEYFDAEGRFFVAGRAPGITLPLAGGELASTGLSTSHILSGDPRLAALVLAAVVHYNLSQPGAQGRHRIRGTDLRALPASDRRDWTPAGGR
jgi:hypothetical protein